MMISDSGLLFLGHPVYWWLFCWSTSLHRAYATTHTLH